MKHLSIFQTLCCATALSLTTACHSSTDNTPTLQASQNATPSLTVAQTTQTTQTLATEVHAVRSYQKILMDNTPVDWTVYNINDQNYVRLADLCPVVGTALTWDATENAVRMTTNAVKPSAPKTNSDAFQTVVDDVISQYGTLDDLTQTGLYNASLLDFSGDGNDDLFLSYVSINNSSQYNSDLTHTSEIWVLQDGVPTRIHQYQKQFASGGNANYGYFCHLVFDGTRWGVKYEDYLNHMYQNERNIFVVTVVDGRAIYIEELIYSDAANNAATLFNYTYSNVGRDTWKGSYKPGEQSPMDNLENYANFKYEESMSVYHSENLPDQWLKHTHNLHSLPWNATLEDIHAVETKQTIFLDGESVDWKVYNVNDENYILLADLCPEINVELEWDATENAVKMTSKNTQNIPTSTQYYTLHPDDKNISFPLPNLTDFYGVVESLRLDVDANYWGNVALYGVYRGYLELNVTDYISEVLSASYDTGNGEQILFYENGELLPHDAPMPIVDYGWSALHIIYTLKDKDAHEITVTTSFLYENATQNSVNIQIETEAQPNYHYTASNFDPSRILLQRDADEAWAYPAYSIWDQKMVDAY